MSKSTRLLAFQHFLFTTSQLRNFWVCKLGIIPPSPAPLRMLSAKVLKSAPGYSFSVQLNTLIYSTMNIESEASGLPVGPTRRIEV
ncbi:unnamed protein product [Protopolystoma xenopodis]|uniref:Uncharacterized protein n=1 Tax=Protopolystoma xenopodis TaxID=117903 RepID=A0A3S5BIW7_9PLAT|nr:unnamed protein product [Protopolystoma xenopodis]